MSYWCLVPLLSSSAPVRSISVGGTVVVFSLVESCGYGTQTIIFTVDAATSASKRWVWDNPSFTANEMLEYQWT